MSSASARSFHSDLDLVSPREDAAGRNRETDRHGPQRPQAPAKMSERRGPFRPEKLSPVRARMSGAAIARLARLCDLVLLGACAVVSFAVVHPQPVLSAPVGQALALGLAVLLAAGSLRIVHAYDFRAGEPLVLHLARTSGGVVLALVAGSILRMLVPAKPITDAGVATWALASFAAVYLSHLGWWAMVRRWRRAGLLTPNIVVVGATRNAEKLIEGLLETREAAVLGVFDDRLGRAPDAICRVPVLGDTAALLSHRITPCIDRVVITVPASAQGRVRQLVEQLRVLPNDISLFLDFEGAAGPARAVSRLASAPLAQVSGAAREENRAIAKRTQDLVLGSAVLVLALPVMALVALAVKLDSPGPVLFRQRRHGFNNEQIVVWKFRSMRHQPDDGGQVRAGDERITRIGRLIRRTSLDELPQILNVLRGEMSLVGPRPHAIGMKTGPTESARLVAEYAHRHRMKPGITGWAAINGSRGPVHTAAEVRRRVALDIDYIERQSTWLDLYILLMTLPCLFGDRAAVR